jgi:hypothetical protein
MEVPYMKNSRFLLLLMMVIPWFSLPFLGKKAIKQYLPAAIFIPSSWRIILLSAADGGGFIPRYTLKSRGIYLLSWVPSFSPLFGS